MAMLLETFKKDINIGADAREISDAHRETHTCLDEKRKDGFGAAPNTRREGEAQHGIRHADVRVRHPEQKHAFKNTEEPCCTRSRPPL